MQTGRKYFQLHRSPYAITGLPDHVEAVMGRLREADQLEVYAATGRDPDKALRDAWKNSLHRWSIVWRGEIIGLFGLSSLSLMGRTGVPWLLGTDKMKEIKLTFVKQSVHFISAMLEIYPVLMNWVDARNTLSIRWLKWLGFKMKNQPQPYGFEKRPFYYFEKRRDQHV